MSKAPTCSSMLLSPSLHKCSFRTMTVMHCRINTPKPLLFSWQRSVLSVGFLPPAVQPSLGESWHGFCKPRVFFFLSPASLKLPTNRKNVAVKCPSSRPQALRDTNAHLTLKGRLLQIVVVGSRRSYSLG